jgi:alpha-glucosidase
VTNSDKTTLKSKVKGGSRSRPPWWQTGIIYQIYIRSFCDSDGDGVGDLQGVISKLDYLQELGIDGIWLSPVTVSANEDWGYDVVDYYDIDPELGTMEDFDRLLTEAKRRGIKVLTDFVPNHTSVKHPWFQDALTGKDAKYRDYYIWEDPKTGGRPPSNWRSAFTGGSAWQFHQDTKQFYLHNFLPSQAELNWRNPVVREEFEKIMRFWLDRGVDGFRIDVFNMLIKDARYRDNPKSENHDGFEVKLLGQRPIYNLSRPELHDILKEWRRVADSYKDRRLLLGESTLLYDIRQLASYYGTHDELELAFNLGFIHTPFKAPELSEIVAESEAAIASPDWPVWTGSNHDQPRFPSRWCGNDERKIRCALLMLLSLRGTPVLYYGDEMGMSNTYVAPWRIKDPMGRKFWPVFAGRDRERTPMPWRNRKGAGFTDTNARPWLPYGDLSRNVATQRTRKDTTWQFTRDLIKIRRQNKELQLGDYHQLPTVSSVWAWRRGATTVVINMSKFHHELVGIEGAIKICTNRSRDGEELNDILHLAPWEGAIIS